MNPLAFSVMSISFPYAAAQFGDYHFTDSSCSWAPMKEILSQIIQTAQNSYFIGTLFVHKDAYFLMS